MEKASFTHKVSKGSRFNQIYIPKEMNNYFGVGDLVEITLLKKKSSVFYSENLKKLNPFKENLIKEILSILSSFKEVKQSFIIGSFLTQKSDYNDIDILLISDKKIEEKIHSILAERFELKFHILSISENSFEYLQKSCPLTRSMLYYFVSNKAYSLPKEIKIDKNHLKFLLMMPEDLLNLNLTSNSRIYYDSLRRLIAIENFLKNKELDPSKLDYELISLIKESLYKKIKSNETLDVNSIKFLKELLEYKLKTINKYLK